MTGWSVPGPMQTRSGYVTSEAAILEAASRVIGRDGLAAASVQAIADEAGVAKGTIYLYFQSRDQLLDIAAEAALLGLFNSLDAVIETAGDFSQSLSALVRAHLGFFEQHPELIQLYLGVADPALRLTRQVHVHPLYRAYVRRLVGFFERAALRGAVALPASPERFVALLVASLHGIVLHRATEADPVPVEDDIRFVSNVLAASLAAPSKGDS